MEQMSLFYDTDNLKDAEEQESKDSPNKKEDKSKISEPELIDSENVLKNNDKNIISSSDEELEVFSDKSSNDNDSEQSSISSENEKRKGGVNFRELERLVNEIHEEDQKSFLSMKSIAIFMRFLLAFSTS